MKPPNPTFHRTANALACAWPSYLILDHQNCSLATKPPGGAMRKKLLLLAALLVASALSFDRPATALTVCGYAFCYGEAQCICPNSTPAAGNAADCMRWRTDCYYL